jgi:hypothetical protein
MTQVPNSPKVYHITHADNLAGIIRQGVLWSDARRIELALVSEVVGISSIKRRRLHELPVKCHSAHKVGAFVPFYFCPRSVMLYLLHKGNHPEVTYQGGQEPILHLVADLRRVVAWANERKRLWAFTNANAGASYTDFFADLESLGEIDWSAVQSSSFWDPVVKEGKQAEFLLHESFPWELIESIGVHNRSIEQQVLTIIRSASHRPLVRVESPWYF